MIKEKSQYLTKLQLEALKNIETAYFDLKPLFRHNEDYLSLKERFNKNEVTFEKFLEDSDKLFCSIPKTQIKKEKGAETLIEALNIKSNYNSK